MIRNAMRFLGSVVSGSPNEEEPPCPSLVLLLDRPMVLTRQSALELAVRAWGDGNGIAEIVRNHGRGRWLVRTSNVLFGLRSSGRRYRRHGIEGNQVRQRAWERHHAWLEVNYPDAPRIPESEWASCYKLLFLMANHVWGENCLGIYLPVQDVTVPNMGDLIDSIRWAGKNGTPLPFLHETADDPA
jgi:hypothetical protein